MKRLFALMVWLAVGSAGWAEEKPRSLTDQPAAGGHINGACCASHRCRDAKTLVELLLGPRDANGDENGEAEEEPLAADRPDFVESSSNVGRGRVQIEMGYTYLQDRSGGETLRSHSYPEVLVRIGLFADWLELRIGQNFASESVRGLGVRASASGTEDLLIGVGLALTEQKGLLPESRIIIQTTVPSGASDFSDNEMLPGINLLYGWEVIEGRLSLGMSTFFGRARDDSGDFYLEFAQAATTAVSVTDKLGLYLEVFGLFASGAEAPGTGPKYFFDGGFTYRFTNNLQFDIRGGVGLNRRAEDFFVGSGFVVRF